MAASFYPGRGYRFDFRLYGLRHRSPRGFPTKREALDAEAVLRTQLRRQKAGLEPEPAPLAPTFTEWATVYLEHVHERARHGLLKRPDIIEGNVRVILRFFGAKPAQPPEEPIDYPTPYHNIRLDDPIRDPQWVRAFDDWLTERKVSSSTRNHYLNTLSRLYWLAQHPEYRQPLITFNPFGFRPRGRWRRRTAIVTPQQLVTWLQHASYHARLAMAIAALAPKLRLRNVLDLHWRDIDRDHGLITVHTHKSELRTGQPLVSPISEPLAAILADARRRHPNATHVVLYRGRSVQTIDGAVRAAAEAAGLTWGRNVQHGVTFHSLRHSMATLLARLHVHPLAHQAAMGHQDFQTTLGYVHLDGSDERPALAMLANHLGIQAAVTGGPVRARRAGGVSGAGRMPGGISRASGVKTRQNRATAGLQRGQLRSHAKPQDTDT